MMWQRNSSKIKKLLFYVTVSKLHIDILTFKYDQCELAQAVTFL